MTTQAVLDELDARIAARSILSHPFYRAWNAGTLTRRDLAVYARVYYPHVASFPEHLERAAERADLPAVRAELLANLHEERSVPAPHAELWLRFAAAVGCDPAAVAAAAPSPAAARTVEEFRRLCEGSSAAALAALYAYESQQPEVSRRKDEGLREHYGVSDPEALSYFRVHAEADLRHRAGERQAMAACLDAGEPAGEVLGAAEAALAAYWQLLDGVNVEIAAAAA
jgi:pyrroloquinoline-quinone synthase